MVTLAMSSVAAGAGMLSYQGIPAFLQYDFLKTLVNGDIAGMVPYTFLVGIVVFLIMFVIQRYTAYGRYIYSIGDNETIPKVSGISIDKVKIISFVLAGLCVGVAGVLSAGKLGRGTIPPGKTSCFRL